MAERLEAWPGPSSYATGRKRHVRVPQQRYVELFRDLQDAEPETATARCDDIAEHLDVSPATAKGKLDGLVHQGELRIVGGSGFGTEYALPTKPDLDQLEADALNRTEGVRQPEGHGINE